MYTEKRDINLELTFKSSVSFSILIQVTLGIMDNPNELVDLLKSVRVLICCDLTWNTLVALLC
jgi:hypothetical protein